MQQLDDTSIPRTRIHFWLAAVAVLMFGFAFALVPLYDAMCRALGINGKIAQVAYSRDAIASMVPVAREVRIEMVTSNSDSVGWSFLSTGKRNDGTPGRNARGAVRRQEQFRPCHDGPGDTQRYPQRRDELSGENRLLLFSEADFASRRVHENAIEYSTWARICRKNTKP